MQKLCYAPAVALAIAVASDVALPLAVAIATHGEPQQARIFWQ